MPDLTEKNTILVKMIKLAVLENKILSSYYKLFFKIYFKLDNCFYNSVLASAMQKHESAINILFFFNVEKKRSTAEF